MSPDIALVRGPYLRAGGVLPWEWLHRNDPEINVTAFSSDPPRHDTDSLEMPVESLAWPDGRLSMFGYPHFLFSALTKFRLPRALLRGMRDLVDEYDMIHTSENFNLFSAQAAALCARSDTRFVFTAGENIPFHPHSYPSALHKRYVNRRADAATATTVEGKRALIHEGVPHDAIAVVPNAVRSSLFSPGAATPADLELPNRLTDRFTISFVHRLCEQKGTPYLLDAFAEFKQRVPEAALVLIGDNRLPEAYYRNRVASTSGVFHVQRVPYERMSDVYNLSDVFVLPSVTMRDNEEQFGMALTESMACAIPSVVTNVGGLPHVAEAGTTSLVIEERSTEALLDAFDRLYDDPALRERLASGARRHYEENYTVEEVGRTLRSFYRDHL